MIYTKLAPAARPLRDARRGGTGDLPRDPDQFLPRVSKAVQLRHLRIAITSEAAIALTGSDEPGVALPGEGQGFQVEPIVDKLSARIAAMNDKYGADLGDADKVWVDRSGRS